ncbi:hypothetical protein WME91_54090 [Sorangium sp. So ce269]
MERSRFDEIQEQIKKNDFLAKGNCLDNELAKLLLDTAYVIMRKLGWPESLWSFAEEFQGERRYFFGGFGDRESVGVGLNVTVANMVVQLRFSVERSINPTLFRFYVDSTDVGLVNPTDESSLVPLVEAVDNSIVQTTNQTLEFYRSGGASAHIA